MAWLERVYVERELEKKIWIKTIFSITAALALLPVAALAGHHMGGDHAVAAVAAEQMGDDVVWTSGARGIVAEVEGEVIAVDVETREVVVRGPAGKLVTLTARGRMHTVGGVEMAKLDNVRLDETVVVVFTEALVLSLKEI